MLFKSAECFVKYSLVACFVYNKHKNLGNKCSHHLGWIDGIIYVFCYIPAADLFSQCSSISVNCVINAYAFLFLVFAVFGYALPSMLVEFSLSICWVLDNRLGSGPSIGLKSHTVSPVIDRVSVIDRV